MLAVFTGIQWWIVHSPWGRAFKALREKSVAGGLARGRRAALHPDAFAIGSAYGGFAGALFAPLVQFIEPNSFQLSYSIKYLLMVIVGGAGSFADRSSAPPSSCSCPSGCASPAATTS